MAAGSTLVLALGPTNTGKTHRAIERLLELPSGMIGLPLRLLAREVYDRITARIGEGEVALVTGEEKRVPPRPRYWVCTVEAMPLDVPVDIVVIDEVQLAAHRERGHVFTDRVLHRRGRQETWFLGADTMAPILRMLLDDDERSQRIRCERFSALRYAGRSGIGGLPKRSAAVAFRAEEVYELAARLRAKRGGAAVVLGALSPRTRNAQVALYQAGEVDYLVATDAIGMGLNLDIDHVAFASGRKFDGRELRRLRDAELAQIAGRAGRHRRDGSFGVLRPMPALDERTVRAIEGHRFAPVRSLVWRSRDLDFGSVDALLESLAAPPSHDALKRVEQADDFDLLRSLGAKPEIHERATDPERVALLWEVCQVPDYRKLLLMRHAQLLTKLYLAVSEGRALDADFVESRVRSIDRSGGEIDDLTARLSAVRVWTYLAHRKGWLPDAARWRSVTQEVEDRLSDALHERLVERFVEVRRRSVAMPAGEDAPAPEGPFAALAGMLEAAPEGAPAAAGPDAWIQRVVDAAHGEIAVDRDGVVHVEGATIGRLRPSGQLRTPAVAVTEGLSGGAQLRVQRRLAAWSKDYVRRLLAPLTADDLPSGPVRGLLYQLEQNLGTVRRKAAKAQLEALSDEQREALTARGVVLGRRAVYHAELHTDEAMAARALLVWLRFGKDAPRPTRDARSVPTRGPDRALLALGFVPVGATAVRADALEEMAVVLEASAEAGEPPPPEWDAALGPSSAEVRKALGYETADDGTLRRRRRRRRRRPAAK